MQNKVVRLPLYILLFSGLISGHCCFGQAGGPIDHRSDVYQLSLQKDIPLASVALGLTLTHLLMNKDQSISLESVMGLNPEHVNEFDEPAIGKFSTKADKASDIFLYTSMSAPALLFIDPKIRKDWKEVTLIGGETYLIGFGLVALTKNLVHRPRPLAYNTSLSVEDRAEYGSTNSFVSGHTAATAMATFMMASIIIDYHPDTKWKPLIWTMASGIPLTTGMLRYKAGKHYFTDIAAGYAIGAITGYFVPHIHQKIKTRVDSKNLELTELFEY